MRMPWWLGPVIGPVVGVFAYFQYGMGPGQPFDAGLCAAFAGVGLAAGFAVALGDLIPPPTREPGREPPRPGQRGRYYLGVALLIGATPLIVVGALNTRDRGLTPFGAGCFAAGAALLGAAFSLCRLNRGRPTQP